MMKWKSRLLRRWLFVNGSAPRPTVVAGLTALVGARRAHG
jgi:hypothetical protein